jgi:hypothetical protein
MPDDPFAATAYEMLSGGLVMLPLALFTLHDFSPSMASILGWIYLVTFGSIVGYTAYVWLLANAPLGLVSTYAYESGVAIAPAAPRGAADVAPAPGAAIVVAWSPPSVAEPPSATQLEEGVRCRDGRADRRARSR